MGILAISGLPYVPRKKIVGFFFHITDKSIIVQDGCILSSSFFCVFADLDSVLAHNHTIRNLANIQPFWPHTLSGIPIYWFQVTVVYKISPAYRSMIF